MYEVLIGLSPHYVTEVSAGELELMNISLVEYIVVSSIVENGLTYKIIVSTHDYKYVALLRGKELIESIHTKKCETKYLYKDKVDALIQMAYICAKAGVKKDNIYNVTNEAITSQAYQELWDIFENDFPEKLI